MTFEEWFVRSGWFGFGSAVEIAANDGYNAGYKQAIVDCYGEAAAPLVLESLRKALNRPVEPFSSGGEGQGSQTQVAQPLIAAAPRLLALLEAAFARAVYRDDPRWWSEASAAIAQARGQEGGAAEA